MADIRSIQYFCRYITSLKFNEQFIPIIHIYFVQTLKGEWIQYIIKKSFILISNVTCSNSAPMNTNRSKNYLK